MTGMLTAFFLRERGFDVVLLEEHFPGWGSSSRTTAKITVQHRTLYSHLLNQIGIPLTQRYARRQMQAVNDFGALVKRLGISCEFQRAPSYLYVRRRATRLQEELSAAQMAGLPVQWTRNTELPFPVAGAIQFNEQAHFHPLKFLYALVPHLNIFAHTRAERVENGIVYAKHGRVRADHIVITARLPLLDLPGQQRSHREKACAIALEGVPKTDGMYQECIPGGLSLRPFSGGMLLAGGRHPVGLFSMPESFAHLEHLARTFWPDCRISAGWTFSEWFPNCGLPFVNAHIGRKADLYVAPSFSARGMTSSMVAARFISERIAESRA